MMVLVVVVGGLNVSWLKLALSTGQCVCLPFIFVSYLLYLSAFEEAEHLIFIRRDG